MSEQSARIITNLDNEFKHAEAELKKKDAEISKLHERIKQYEIAAAKHDATVAILTEDGDKLKRKLESSDQETRESFKKSKKLQDQLDEVEAFSQSRLLDLESPTVKKSEEKSKKPDPVLKRLRRLPHLSGARHSSKLGRDLEAPPDGGISDDASDSLSRLMATVDGRPNRRSDLFCDSKPINGWRKPQRGSTPLFGEFADQW